MGQNRVPISVAKIRGRWPQVLLRGCKIGLGVWHIRSFFTLPLSCWSYTSEVVLLACSSVATARLFLPTPLAPYWSQAGAAHFCAPSLHKHHIWKGNVNICSSGTTTIQGWYPNLKSSWILPRFFKVREKREKLRVGLVGQSQPALPTGRAAWKKEKALWLLCYVTLPLK